jgi:hypothetical protein
MKDKRPEPNRYKSILTSDCIHLLRTISRNLCGLSNFLEFPPLWCLTAIYHRGSMPDLG